MSECLNVACETRHHCLLSVAHPIDHPSTSTTTTTPGVVHFDGSVHFPLQSSLPQTLDCDSHHSISTHTENHVHEKMQHE